MVHRHQSDFAVSFEPGLSMSSYRDTDSPRVLMDVRDLGVIADQRAELAAEGLADPAHAAHRLKQWRSA